MIPRMCLGVWYPVVSPVVLLSLATQIAKMQAVSERQIFVMVHLSFCFVLQHQLSAPTSGLFRCCADVLFARKHHDQHITNTKLISAPKRTSNPHLSVHLKTPENEHQRNGQKTGRKRPGVVLDRGVSCRVSPAWCRS